MTAIREMHGLSLVNGKRTPLHALWLNLRSRCNNPKTPDYRYYGGRGIRVCDRWNRFVHFAEDVGPHPGPGWTLDRIDNDGDYEPGNVRWATRKTQGRNRNYCTLDQSLASEIVELYRKGQHQYPKVKQSDLAKMYGVHQSTISAVIRGAMWK